MTPPQRRGWRRLALALGACIVVVLALRAALPWALARGLGWAGRELLGIPLQVRNVDLGLFRGQVVLEGVGVGRPEGPQGAVSWLRADRLGADLAWPDLWERRIRLENVEVDGLELQLVRRPDGSIDFFVPREAAAEPPADAGAWPLTLDAVEIRDVHASLVDAADARRLASLSFDALDLTQAHVDQGQVRVVGADLHGPRLALARDFLVGGGEQPPLQEAVESTGTAEAPAATAEVANEQNGSAEIPRIEHLSIEDGTLVVESQTGSFALGLRLQAQSVGGRSGEHFPVELDLTLGDGTLRFEGELGAAPLALDGRLAWSELPLPPLALVASPELAAWLRSCRASGDLELRLHREGGAAPLVLEVRGATRVDDLALVDPQDDEAQLAWQSLQIAGIDAALRLGAPVQTSAAPGRRLDVAAVKLVAPRLHWVQPSPFARPASQEEPVSSSAREAEAQETQIRVESFELEDGEVELLDRSVAPPYRGRLHDLRLRAEALRWPAAAVGSLELRALAPDAALLEASGNLAPESGELHAKLVHLALPPLAPFARGAGYVLEGGQLSLELDARRHQQEVSAKTELVLHGLDVDVLDASGFQKRFGMPLDMALALLRNPKGDIDLSVPIRASVEGVQVGLASIVQDAVRGALTGALTSPLKAAGFVIARGGAGEAVGFEPLESPPGQPGLDAAAEARLAGLAKLLKQRPGLGLELIGSAGPADGPALRAGKVGAGGGLPAVAGGGPEAQLLALARSRAEGVRQALIERGVDPARLRLLEPSAAGPSGVTLDLFAR